MLGTHLSDGVDEVVDAAIDHVSIELLLAQVGIDGDHDHLVAYGSHFGINGGPEETESVLRAIRRGRRPRRTRGDTWAVRNGAVVLFS